MAVLRWPVWPVRIVASAAVVAVALGGMVAPPLAGQEGEGRREFNVSARRYAFSPSRLEVRQNDLVKIAFRAEDIPHSFTVDAYRIAKRAAASQTVVFEFRADRIGTFPIYCNLTLDEGCRDMHGELVVRER